MMGMRRRRRRRRRRIEEERRIGIVEVEFSGFLLFSLQCPFGVG